MTHRLMALCALVLLVTAGCARPEQDANPPAPAGPPQTCPEVAAAIVDDLQDYVGRYAGMTAEEYALLDPSGAVSDLLGRAQQLRALGEELECDREALNDLIAVELERLTGDGPVAEAVAATFRAHALGSPDPSDPPAEERVVSPGENLAAVLMTVGSGSTLILEPGEHLLTESLLILRPISLVGSGRDQTRIVSTAAEAALQYLGDGELRIEGLAIEHRGSAPSSVVVVHSGSARVHRARISGAVHGPDGAGGIGLVLGSGGPGEVSDTDVVGNAGGGIAVFGTQAPTITDSLIRENGGCGVCFLGSGGTLRGSLVISNDVGVIVEGDAAPHIVDNDISANRGVGLSYGDGAGGVAEGNLITGNGDIGVIVGGRAGPELRDNAVANHRSGIALAEQSNAVVAGNRLDRNGTGIEISGSGSPLVESNDIRDGGGIGIRVGDRSRAVIRANTVAGSVDVGIVVVGRARPLVERNTLTNQGTAGIVFLGESAGRAVDNATTGQAIGIQVSEAAGPELVGNSMQRHEQVTLVYFDSAGGSAEGNTCGDGDLPIVLHDQADPVLANNDCRIADQRQGAPQPPRPPPTPPEPPDPEY